MKTTRRFRWLPRCSLSNLLMLMVVVGLSLAWYDQRRKLGEQAEAIEKQRLEITRLTVNNILRSDLPDAEKARALAPFVSLGDSLKEIERWCGELGALGDNGSWAEGSFSDCDLVVEFGLEEKVI